MNSINRFSKLDVSDDDEINSSTNNVDRKAKKMLKKIKILKKKNISELNDDQKKTIKTEDYWRSKIIDTNYTRYLPSEIQNIILSYIDTNTRLKLIQRQHTLKTISIVNNDITKKTKISHIYGIQKCLKNLTRNGMFENMKSTLLKAPFSKVYITGYCNCSYKKFRNDYIRYPLGHIKYIQDLLQYILKNSHKFCLKKHFQDKNKLSKVELGMKNLYLHILRLT